MSNAWQEVWQRRRLEVETSLDLQRLIDLDGYDSGTGRMSAGDWRAFAASACALLRLSAGDSVYEAGCGSGAFLYALREQVGLRVGGCDWAPALVQVARRALPGGDFQVLEASALPPEPRYDVVVSNGVFQYFPGLDYAAAALRRMTAKALRAVALFDVPDLARREEAESFRRGALSPEFYDRDYAGLRHLYFDRDWFEPFAREAGMSPELLASPMPNYPQGAFRFAVLLSRG
jgi:SAM-dependent methyltransferase